jgi:hypothetical protein
MVEPVVILSQTYDNSGVVFHDLSPLMESHDITPTFVTHQDS